MGRGTVTEARYYVVRHLKIRRTLCQMVRDCRFCISVRSSFTCAQASARSLVRSSDDITKKRTCQIFCSRSLDLPERLPIDWQIRFGNLEVISTRSKTCVFEK